MSTPRKNTFGLIVGNRGFFPDHLAASGRVDMIEAIEASGAAVVALTPGESKHGAVETYDEARRCADLFKSRRDEIDGIVVTRKIEEKMGTMVKPGEPFCEIIDHRRMAAEMSVPETDLSLVHEGKNVELKLNAFPTSTFDGTVERIGSQTLAEAGEQYFLVRAIFENPGGLAKDGMVGRARIRAGGGFIVSGWYPVGYVVLRSPVRWLWQKVWGWLP